MVQKVITLKVPNLPSDWKTTIAGLISAGAIALEDYSRSGSVTLRGACVAVAIAMVGYLAGDKNKPGKPNEDTPTI